MALVECDVSEKCVLRFVSIPHISSYCYYFYHISVCLSVSQVRLFYSQGLGRSRPQVAEHDPQVHRSPPAYPAACPSQVLTPLFSPPFKCSARCVSPTPRAGPAAYPPTVLIPLPTPLKPYRSEVTSSAYSVLVPLLTPPPGAERLRLVPRD